MMRNLTFIFLFFSLPISAQVSEHIHVDQFGYLPEMSKVAVISNPQSGYNAADSYMAGSSIHLVRANDGAIIYTGAPTSWENGQTDASSGDQGWWFDFTAITTPGTYRILDPSTGEQSAEFIISDEAFSDVMDASMRMFYYNRCNAEKPTQFAGQWSDGMNFMNAGQDADCRDVYTPSSAASAKDLSGGWFDAGDYNKYVTFAESPVHDLLSAYEENPQAFSDDTGIPESGNGVADVLDEVKWELDWLLKMCNPDGSTHIKMGSTDHNVNSASPPSANTDPRYYGLTCSSASLAVAGMFAHAASVYAEEPGMSAFVASLTAEAEAAWAYVLPSLNTNALDLDCDDGSIVAGDADRSAEEQREMALTASAYLYLLTGTQSYENYVVANLTDASPIANEFWGGEGMPLKDALLTYADSPSADATTSAQILNGFTISAQNNWNGFFGFNASEDLYRAMVPNWVYGWGSNMGKANYGVLNQMLVEYQLDASASADYALKVSEQLHYFHGVNPQGLVYLSNMGESGADRSINEIYHAWFADGTDYDSAIDSPLGPPPGYLVGGPNPYFTLPAISPPAGQPDQKAYKDWNTSWPENSWEISEPAIYYQAAYVRLLANFVDVTAQGCPEDLNSDGVVDVNDFIMFNSEFDSPCALCPSDIDGNGVVDVDDFILFNSAFGADCE